MNEWSTHLSKYESKYVSEQARKEGSRKGGRKDGRKKEREGGRREVCKYVFRFMSISEDVTACSYKSKSGNG